MSKYVFVLSLTPLKTSVKADYVLSYGDCIKRCDFKETELISPILPFRN